MFWGKQRSASSPSRLYCSSLFCECPKFCDLAKQRRKTFGGFLRSEKTIFRSFFSGGHRSGCVLQLKRQQHTKDGETVAHQDHFRCTITCGYCGKRRHYEDECHTQKRESDKHKWQEAERQKAQTASSTPQNEDKGGKGGGKEGGNGETPNPQRRSSAPATSPSPADADPKKRPQGDNASPKGSDSKKRRLVYMAKSLMAAGVDVKFPAEEYGGGSEEQDLVFWLLVKIGDQVFRAVLDTGATLSILARCLLKTFKKTKTVAIRVGDGRTIHSLGGVNVTICLGDETVTQHCRVLDTDAFVIVIGTDFLRRNPQVKMLSLQRPYSLHCDFGSGLFSVPLVLSGRKDSGLRYAAKTHYRTENYQLARHVLENGLAALQVSLDDIQVELFASQQQHIMQLYCSKHLNNAFCFFWKAMGLAYANPPFSLLAKVLTKIAYAGGRVVICAPDWDCSGEHAYWRRLLDRMTVGRVQLPNGPIYVPEDSDTAMQAPEWASFLSIVDGSLNRVPLCDLDQVLLKEVMAQNRGLTLFDLNKRSPEQLSATLTGCESPDGDLEPPSVKEDADDQLSEIASSIPPVDPSDVELKHSAFLAKLLLEEVDLESTSEPTSPVRRLVLHMQHTCPGEPVAQSPDALARPASNNMPLSEHDTQELRRLLYLRAEGIERQARLQYLRQTWKSSIWYEEDDDSYTLPDAEIPLVYSLHYGQQCSPEWDDGSVPGKTADRQKKKEHCKSSLQLRGISCRKSRV